MLLIISYVLSFCVIVNAQMKLILLPNNTKGGQCMDGSPAGLYYSPPPSGSSDLWIIFIQGGGGCSDQKSCEQRTKSSKGSSNYFHPTMQGKHELSNDPSINPDFYTGHKIFCEYCTSDAWGGQRTEPSSNPDTWGYIFGGHLVFKSLMQYASDNLNMFDAQYVLVTGNSAGGIGLFGNIDWLRNEFKTKGKYKNLTFKASPNSGWFFPGNTTDELNNPMMPPNDFPHWIKNTTGGIGHDDSMVILYDGYINPACAQGLGSNLSWQCASTHNLYKYITSPIFVMENKYDCDAFIEGMQMPEPW
eukprot:188309_1